MKNKILNLIVLSVIIVFFWNCSGPAPEVKTIDNGVELYTKDLNMRVQFYNNNIVRVLKWLPESSPDKKSLSVIVNEINNLEIELTQDRNTIRLKSDALQVNIEKDDCDISYYTPDGLEIVEENGTSYTPVVFSGDSAYSVKQIFELTGGEGIYGLGQHQYGYMNYRGKTVKLVQSNTDAVNPFLVSTQNYGILWDNYSMTIYEDDGIEEASLWSDVGDNIDYYFFIWRKHG